MAIKKRQWFWTIEWFQYLPMADECRKKTMDSL